MNKNKTVLLACGIGFSANFILFAVKLYVGLRSNSISIFSDSVNNLLDSLSGLISLVSLYIILFRNKSAANKGEQLFSFLISLTVMGAGIYFAYCSVERFMYPTRIWFSYTYVIILCGTALAKIIMYLLFRRMADKSGSSVVAVMKTDCILDFFITSITVLSLFLSQYGSFSFDALFGLIISAIIIVSAFRIIISGGKELINYVSPGDKEKIESIILDYGDSVKVKSIDYYVENGCTFAFLTASVADKNSMASFIEKIYNESGIRVKIINSEE